MNTGGVGTPPVIFLKSVKRGDNVCVHGCLSVGVMVIVNGEIQLCKKINLTKVNKVSQIHDSDYDRKFFDKQGDLRKHLREDKKDVLKGIKELHDILCKYEKGANLVLIDNISVIDYYLGLCFLPSLDPLARPFKSVSNPYRKSLYETESPESVCQLFYKLEYVEK